MSAAAGLALAASITATALVVSNDAAARPSSALRTAGLLDLAGDPAGARGSSQASGRQASGPDSVSELSRQARDYESRGQSAQETRASQRAQAARRARVLAAQRRAADQRAAAQRAAAERAAEQPPATQPSTPPTADAQPKTDQPKTDQPKTDAPAGSPQQIAAAMLASFGWASSEFGCLNELWERESGWNPSATNPYSGAYGIPQALPASKMASAGADWATNPATQIRWGLDYIKATYGAPCAAWSHETATGWY
jgi:hypothetical protein